MKINAKYFYLYVFIIGGNIFTIACLGILEVVYNLPPPGLQLIHSFQECISLGIVLDLYVYIYAYTYILHHLFIKFIITTIIEHI